MKCLIAEDNPVSSLIIGEMISRYAVCDAVINGQDAVNLFMKAHESNSPYNLIVMDIMMPDIDGLDPVRMIRDKEELMGIPLTRRVKVIMTIALDDPRTVIKVLEESYANSFLVKPISSQVLVNVLGELNLMCGSALNQAPHQRRSLSHQTFIS